MKRGWSGSPQPRCWLAVRGAGRAEPGPLAAAAARGCFCALAVPSRRALPLLLHSPCCQDGKPGLSPSAKTPSLTNENGSPRVASGGNWEGEKVTLRLCVWHCVLKRCGSWSSRGKRVPAWSAVPGAVPALEHRLVAEEPFHHLHLVCEGVTG